MIVAGLDPSLTGCAVALFNATTGSHAAHTFPSEAADGLGARFMRFDTICSKVLDKIGGAALCCVEGYSYDSRGGKAFDRVELGTLLRSRLMLRTKLVEIPPGTLKLFAAGKGNVNKTAMALAVYKRWGYEFGDDNQVDAYCLARMAACIAGFAQPENDAQRRALDSLNKPKTKKKKTA